MRGRCQSIKGHLLVARKWCQFRSASSTIESLMMLATTSTSTDARSMGMARSEATAPTVADAMTAMGTGWH